LRGEGRHGPGEPGKDSSTAARVPRQEQLHSCEQMEDDIKHADILTQRTEKTVRPRFIRCTFVDIAMKFAVSESLPTFTRQPYWTCPDDQNTERYR